MKIRLDELYNEIGTVFRNDKDLIAEFADGETFTALPKGSYLIVDMSQDFGTVFELYDVNKNKNISFEIGMIYEDFPDLEFETVYINPLEVVNMAIDSKNKNILQLASEGWEINRENKYFDLTPEIKKFEVLSELKRILENKENQEEEKLYTQMNSLSKRA